MNKNVFYYDSGDDSLTFINKGCNAKYTVNTGLALLSINNKKEIVSLELMGAHKNFHISKEMLENLIRSKVTFTFHKEDHSLVINMQLFYKKKDPIVIINTVPFKDYIMKDQIMEATAGA